MAKFNLKEHLGDLVEKESNSVIAIGLAATFAAIAALLCGFYAIKIKQYITDDSTLVVQCPTEYNYDSPVLLKAISHGSAIEKDRFIRGFVRNVLMNIHPRTKVDAEKSLQWLKNHTVGVAASSTQSFLDNKERFVSLIAGGTFQEFFPYNSTESKNFRVRKAMSGIVVEIDGFYVKHSLSHQDRKESVLRMLIKECDQSTKNVYGLCLSEYKYVGPKDGVSGE